MDHIYISIDLKSFYASVECVDRELDPLDTAGSVTEILQAVHTLLPSLTRTRTSKLISLPLYQGCQGICR